MRKFLGAALACALTLGWVTPALALTQDEQLEVQIGQQEYQDLQQKGEIVTSSPYYSVLDPIAEKIEKVADPQYFTPFHFILVNESQPNAFAVPGGNVYVTTSMMKFVQNKEELAGVLCHETSHDIHHDVLNLYKKDQQLSLYGTLAELLLGRGANGLANTVINLAANLESLHFSRQVEENADLKGALTCAQAGVTPFGMIWLMQAFQSSNMPNPPEFLSNHPDDAHRISALQNLFASEPQTFNRFQSNIACGTPVSYSGFYYQYKPGCGVERRQSTAVGRASTGTSSTHHIAPVSSRKKPKCTPGWKYC